MKQNERTQLDVVVDRAVKQSEARVNAKAIQLQAKLRDERAKLLGHFLSSRVISQE